nr:uncharacterized protein LOC129452877 [Misgurnus anguillicaudatus]
MRTNISFLFISLSICGVYGVDPDEVISVSVIEGDSVTLHTDITEIQRDDVIEWRFGDQQDLIAKLNREANKSDLYNGTDERFSGRLKMNTQTGDLTITNIRSQLTGVYKLEITRDEIKKKTFVVRRVFHPESDQLKSVSVMEEDSVTLLTDVSDIKKYDEILWRLRRENSPLAELNRKTTFFSTYDDVLDGRFKGRLQLDHQTGSLTITNIRNTDSGLYDVEISSSSSSHTIHQSFTVTVKDKVKIESVMEGDSVTLHTNLTEIQRHNVILWSFATQDTLIAKIDKDVNKTSIYDDVLDGRFRDRLILNDQTGDLTITNVRTDDAGLYELKMSSRRRSIQRRLIVTVTSQSSTLVSGILAGIYVPLGIIAAVALVYYCRRCFPKARTQIVMEGDTVILHTDVTVRKDDDEMAWTFQKSLIAQIERSKDAVYDGDDVLNGRFKDRLTLRPQSGSLTINDTRTTDAGVYQLKIINNWETSYKRVRLIVTATNKQMMVNKGQSYILKPDITDIQDYDVIEWKFGDEETLIAQIDRAHDIFSTYDGDDGLFRDQLELNRQTGDLTITEIRQEHTGDYKFKAIKREKTSYRRFSVHVIETNGVTVPLINGNSQHR